MSRFGIIKKLFGIKREAKRVVKEAGRIEARLEEAINSSATIASKISIELDQANQLNEKLSNKLLTTEAYQKDLQADNEALQRLVDSLQDELKNLKEITIPGLVASSNLLTDRWEAQQRVAQIAGRIKEQTDVIS